MRGKDYFIAFRASAPGRRRTLHGRAASVTATTPAPAPRGVVGKAMPLRSHASSRVFNTQSQFPGRGSTARMLLDWLARARCEASTL
jgi:hypothetical protein